MPSALYRHVSVCLAAVSFLALAGVSVSPAGQVKKVKPDLEFKGMNRESAKVAGKFVVWEYEAAKGVVTKLAIDFVQRSEETGPPLYGVVRYNSSFK